MTVLDSSWGYLRQVWPYNPRAPLCAAENVFVRINPVARQFWVQRSVWRRSRCEVHKDKHTSRNLQSGKSQKSNHHGFLECSEFSTEKLTVGSPARNNSSWFRETSQDRESRASLSFNSFPSWWQRQSWGCFSPRQLWGRPKRFPLANTWKLRV